MGKEAKKSKRRAKAGKSGRTAKPRRCATASSTECTGDQAKDNPHWRELKQLLGDDCPLLQVNALHVIPSKLITKLNVHVPKLLGAGRKAEILLAKFCKENGFAGFWRQKPFSYLSLGRQDIDFMDAGGMEVYRRLWPGMSTSDIREKIEAGVVPGAVVGARMQAYLGWLVTEPAYRSELEALRGQGEAVVSEWPDVAAFNRIPTAEDAQRLGIPVSDVAARFYESYRQFCRRWCIEHLVTWDLPVPCNPAWGVSVGALSRDASDQGVLLIVPFTFIPHGKVDLLDMFERIQQTAAPDHLRGWIDKGSASRMGEGEYRFASLFLFHHYWNLIHDRYGERAARRRTKTKAAIGEFLVRDPTLSHDPGTGMANKLFALMRKRLAFSG